MSLETTNGNDVAKRGGNVEPGKEPELTLLLFKRDTFKAVIMMKKEYN